MKTRTDITIPIFFMLFGLFFIIPTLILSNFNLTTFGICWIGLWMLMILMGLWKIETFEISENRLTKTNFLGMFKQTVNLENIIRYEKKVIDSDFIKNPLTIIKCFSNDNRYFVFRIITILTEGSGKMTIDERTVNKEDFDKLYVKIKGRKKSRK
ncbi:MAG: hypothetical protein E6Q45_04860 [Flavobacterium sp.]|nr:MAG: hypothetical protein E6Q45_04860 [Flavobacterium sp.]